MGAFLIHLYTYKFIYMAFIVIAILIVLFTIKPRKVKPINITIDDVKDEKSDIEKVLESLESKEDSRPMTTFEEEQEANAIISYQELVEAVKQKKEAMAVSKVNDNVNIEVNQVKEEPKKFKSSEFISPIFGKDSNGQDIHIKGYWASKYEVQQVN